MKKLAKIIKITLSVLVLLVIIGVLLFKLYGNQAVRLGVETGATQALNVKVGLKSVDLQVLRGAIQLDGLQVGNPAGYENPYMLEFTQGKVAVNIRSLLTDTINVDEIAFDGLAVTIEQKGLTSNIQELTDGMKKSEKTAESTTVKQEPGSQEQKPSKKIVIRHLLITNAQANVKLIPLPGKADTVTVKLAPIEMFDVGKDEKVDVAQLTTIMLTAIVEGVAKQGADVLPKDLVNGLNTGLKSLEGLGGGILKGVGQVGTGVVEGAGKAGEGVIKGAEDVGKGLGGLLGGKKEKKEDAKP